MKRFGLIGLVIMMLGVLVAPVAAQGDGDCEPEAVQTWLVARTLWLNASNEVLQSDLGFGETTVALMNQLEAIEQLDRPTCLDPMMLVTYEGFINLFHGLTCALVDDTDACVERVVERVAAQKEAAAVLYEQFSFSPDDYDGQLPEGWTLPEGN